MDSPVGVIEPSAPTVTPSTGGWWQSKAFKRFRRNPLAIIGAVLVLIFACIAIFAPQLSDISTNRNCMRDLGVNVNTVGQVRNPLTGVFWRAIVAPPTTCYTMPRQSFSPIPTPPSETAIMGTTSGGYDIFYGIVWGTRTAFRIGIIVVAISFIVGLIVGSLSGFFGGWIDNALMRFTDIVIAFPGLVLAMVIVSMLGISLANVIIAISLVAWPNYARIIRGDILKIKEQEFVDGARALGAGNLRLIARHIFPNVLGPIVIVASLDIGSTVLTAAALSFLGLGAPLGYADWGQMINFARNWILGPPGQPLAYWYTSFWPGLTIILFVLGWNLMGDAVRDALDPRSG
jgi:peptide/nickel transport system permease protein